MVDYLTDGFSVSICAISVMMVLRRAPAQWRLCVALIALVATLIPWQGLPSIEIPAAVYVELGGSLTPANLPSGDQTRRIVPPMSSYVLAANAIGCLVFLLLALRHHRYLEKRRALATRRDDLLRHARGQTPEDTVVWLLPDSNEAATTEFPNSEIWVGDRLTASPALPTVMTHEVSHIVANDPKLEWLLVFARSVFWWHPLVWLWTWWSRREMELACDERCARVLGQERYRSDLAALVKQSAGIQGALAMVAKPSFNMARLRRLEHTPRVLRRHGVGIALASPLAVMSVLNLHAAPPSARDGVKPHAVQLCPSDVASSGVTRTGERIYLNMELDEAAADRLRATTTEAVGEQLVFTDELGRPVEDLALTIYAPLHKSLRLGLDSEERAERLQAYFSGAQCQYN